MKVLVISASTGNGHNSAGRALVSEFSRRGWTSEMIDSMDIVSKGYSSWYKGGYETLVKKAPRFWGHLYRSSDRPLMNFWVQTAMDHRFCARFDKLVADHRPDWVVCTHSIVQPRLALLRKKLGFKMAVVVTDLHPHRMWLRGRPDWFFVPTEESAESLRKRLAYTANCTDVVGIPVHPAFCSEALVTRSDDTVLLNSGGIGAGPFQEAIEIFVALGLRVQVVTGNSRATLSALTDLYGKNERVELFGHVAPEQMADLMRSCMLMVGKSGGLTTFEALTTATPFLVLKPFLIPGQEQGNAEWLDQIGAGRYVQSLETLSQVTKELANNPADRELMSLAARGSSSPNSAQLIAHRLESETGR